MTHKYECNLGSTIRPCERRSLRWPRRSTLLVAVLLTASGWATQTAAQAPLAFYTNRGVWEAAVDVLVLEDFELEPLGVFGLPHTTNGVVTIDELGTGSSQAFYDNGLVNGSREPHIRDFTSQITWTPGFSFTAFGFGYDTALESWDVKLGGTTVATLAAYRNGFFGAAAGTGGCVRDPEWLCDGDVDGDGRVNPVDSGLVQAAFGSTDETDLCQYDIDCDGQINPVDSGIVQSLFGTCEEPPDACP